MYRYFKKIVSGGVREDICNLLQKVGRIRFSKENNMSLFKKVLIISTTLLVLLGMISTGEAKGQTQEYFMDVEVWPNKLDIDPAKDLNVRKITAAGEIGGSVPATRKRMEDAWGAKVYDHAGATEIGHWGYECQAQCGLHINEAFHLVEVEDMYTGEAITEPGRSGGMIVTTFDRLAHPCIRFDSKDIIEWSPLEKCECGRTFRLLRGGIAGRADDIVKVKGVLLAPGAIEEVVRAIPQLGDEYEVEVTKKGDIDNVTLKVELLPDYEAETDAIRENLNRELRAKTNLRYDLVFQKYGTLPRYETKAKRFKDLR